MVFLKNLKPGIVQNLSNLKQAIFLKLRQSYRIKTASAVDKNSKNALTAFCHLKIKLYLKGEIFFQRGTSRTSLSKFTSPTWRTCRRWARKILNLAPKAPLFTSSPRIWTAETASSTSRNWLTRSTRKVQSTKSSQVTSNVLPILLQKLSGYTQIHGLFQFSTFFQFPKVANWKNHTYELHWQGGYLDLAMVVR